VSVMKALQLLLRRNVITRNGAFLKNSTGR